MSAAARGFIMCADTLSVAVVRCFGDARISEAMLVWGKFELGQLDCRMAAKDDQAFRVSGLF